MRRFAVGRREHRLVRRHRFAAVLFDRDGTLIREVPHDGDPDRVTPMPGAPRAVGRLRAAGLRLGVVTDQSGVARGELAPAQVAAVNRRVEALLGPFDVWVVCPHDDRAGCLCRKPLPGLVTTACSALGISPARCAVIGDIGSDVTAARAADATAILVPTARTRHAEIATAPLVAPDLLAAVSWILTQEPEDAA